MYHPLFPAQAGRRSALSACAVTSAPLLRSMHPKHCMVAPICCLFWARLTLLQNRQAGGRCGHQEAMHMATLRKTI